MPYRFFTIAAVVACLAASASQVLAAPNEIKVFSDELAAYGQHTFEVHANDVSSAGPNAESGSTPLQVMPEYSYGIWPQWELSVQLPFATEGNKVRSDGYRAELQYVAPHPELGMYWGFNIELAHQVRAGEPVTNGFELVPILGWRVWRWHLIINHGVSQSFSGGDRSLHFSPAAKASYTLFGKNAIGIDYYLEAGPLRRFLPSDERVQLVFLTWVGCQHWRWSRLYERL